MITHLVMIFFQLIIHCWLVFLFVSESVAALASKIKGIKVIPVDKALDNYCIDYKYDLEGNKKRVRKKLP
ncbi:hypothetical protein DaDZ19_34490 [Dickeya ananatis]